MPRRTNLIDEARRDLTVDVARDALKVAELERRIAEHRELATLLGYELVAAKVALRTSSQLLQAHDDRRATMEKA